MMRYSLSWKLVSLFLAGSPGTKLLFEHEQAALEAACSSRQHYFEKYFGTIRKLMFNFSRNFTLDELLPTTGARY